MRHEEIWRKHVPGGGKSEGKGPEASPLEEAGKEGGSDRRDGRRQPGATAKCRVSLGKGHAGPPAAFMQSGGPHRRQHSE